MSQPPHQHGQNPPGKDPATNIVEDDQQLYDWGIENRMDQYYQSSTTTSAAEGGSTGGYHPPPSQVSGEQGYVPNNPNLVYHEHHHPTLYGQPPPAHQNSYQPLTPPPQTAVATTTTGFQFQVGTNHQGKQHQYPSSHQQGASSQSCGVKLEPGTMTADGNPQQTFPPPSVYTPRSGGRRPVLPPVDMDANEIMKVERKRARNRVAASKCRLRKLERIAVLDNQASQLRAENEDLASLADKLRSQVYSLKQEIRWHVNNGCRIFRGAKAQTASPDSTTSNNISPSSIQQQQHQPSDEATSATKQNQFVQHQRPVAAVTATEEV